MLQNYFATCPRGLEALLADELNNIGATAVQALGGGAKFQGDLATCYRANLHSRVATRVLLEVAHGPYRDEHHVYAIAHSVDWPRHFDVRLSIRVDLNASRSPLRSLDFATLRIKDAVCDRFRDELGIRPNVDTHEPGMRIVGFVDERDCTIYLDTSGDALYKRGYRHDVGDAPLKENLAAGLVLLSGWQPEEPFFDPMCGSGTLLSEAAQIALNIAPGGSRHFGFERHLDFDAALWREITSAARATEREALPAPIYGADLYGDELKKAKANLANLGLADMVQLKQANVLESPAPADHGVLISNPPYGKRMGDEESLEIFYPRLGDILKAQFAGWRCYFISADMELPKRIGLKASKRTPVFNGALDCRLFEYKIIAGSMRRAPRPGDESSENGKA